MKRIFTKKWFWIILLVIGGFSWWMIGKQDAEPEYEIVSVERMTITEIVDATGEVEPRDYADIAFALSGEIQEVKVFVGERVAKGEILASLDSASYQATLSQAQSAARIAEADERFARRNWDEIKPEQREAIKLASEQARQNAAVAAAQLEKTFLRAPLEGVIARLDIREGEFASAGARIARISGEEGLRIRADIPESDIAVLEVGQEGVATFDAFGPRKKYAVKLSEIEPEANPMQDVVYYTVYFELDSPEELLRSGMSSDIAIRVAESRDTLSLPFRAIHETEDRVYVEVFDVDGVSIVQKDIETGLEDDEGNQEILSGLSEGENVIVRSQKSL
jgi:RND family efflux transporter MFP subunit